MPRDPGTVININKPNSPSVVEGDLYPIKYLFSLNYIYRFAVFDPSKNVVMNYLPKCASSTLQVGALRSMGKLDKYEGFGQLKKTTFENTLKEKTKMPFDAFKLLRNAQVISVMRDPIGRFISAHNMILTLSDFRDAMERKMRMKLDQRNLVDPLIHYLETSYDIDWHFRPQFNFVRAAMSGKIVTLGSHEFTDAFKSAGVEDWVKAFGSEKFNQSIDNKIISTEEQLRRLRKIYRMDFALSQSRQLGFSA